jgi:hypothetical protein
MPDPVTLSVLTAAALTEGIKFLYGQAGELLKRRRERKDADRKGLQAPSLDVPIIENNIVAGQLTSIAVNQDILDQRGDQLETLSEKLGLYDRGVYAIDPTDDELIARAEALRGLLELAYGQRITLKGENREATGSSVNVDVIVRRVEGQLILAEVDHVGEGGHVVAEGNVDTVAQGATMIGFKAKSVGGPGPG